MSVNEDSSQLADDYSQGSLDENEQFFQTDFYSEEDEVRHVEHKELDGRMLDPGYVRLRRTTVDKNERTKRVTVNGYFTGTNPGTLIRNAVSGRRCSHRVGYVDEDLYFSVIVATGELGQTSRVFFYDNPEQYERHFYTKLTPETKTRWLSKFDYARTAMLAENNNKKSLAGYVEIR